MKKIRLLYIMPLLLTSCSSKNKIFINDEFAVYKYKVEDPPKPNCCTPVANAHIYLKDIFHITISSLSEQDVSVLNIVYSSDLEGLIGPYYNISFSSSYVDNKLVLDIEKTVNMKSNVYPVDKYWVHTTIFDKRFYFKVIPSEEEYIEYVLD